jgi:hypothetical protein
MTIRSCSHRLPILVVVAILGFACGNGSSQGAAGLIQSGLTGRIFVGNCHPVDPACEPDPYPRARLVIRRTQRSKPVLIVRASDDGRFRVRLVPGRYWLTPYRDGASFKDFRVAVPRNGYRAVRVVYDRGIQ